ncbi:MAG TPA: O-antigen ligase family protein [Solirubrobacterales bacterium]|nr:O-antigen ligase family protein [Solirubrobacterales bacterium]
MSDLLAGAGVLIAAAVSAATILLPTGRLRSIAMLAALVLFPALILGDQWHSHQIVDLRDHTSRLVALVLLGVVAAVVLAYAFRRWPILLPLAVVAALPFRVPLHAGGDTANLLVPLYLVIAGGVLSKAFGEWQQGGGVDLGAGFFAWRGSSLAESAVRKTGRRPQIDPPALLPYVLAGVVLLYALQTLYSPDFSKGLQNACFFFVPFSLVYGLLRDVSWDWKLLTLVLWVVAVEAVCFVVVGSVEWGTRSLFWNDQVIRSNEFHTYFRVNSVFWDPNIYGRYLALVAVVAMSALLWARERKTLVLLTALVFVLWLGLFPTFSQSSFAALLAGLAVLAALKWSLRWTLVAVGAFAVLGVLVVLFTGGRASLDRINIDTSGRANLVSGGIHLFAQRPIYGYGSGSFPKAYREHVETHKAPVSVSHTEPITIAAEQGILGVAAYIALVVTALWTMAAGLRPSLLSLSVTRAGGVGGGGSRTDRGPPAGPPPPATGSARLQPIARAAVLATFVALLVHTMAYAGFFEDPITWVLLGVGASLAAADRPGAASSAPRRVR